MSLPKIGSVLQSKNIYSGRWEAVYIFLGSHRPKVFLFNRTGMVVQEDISRLEIGIEYGRLRVVPDE